MRIAARGGVAGSHERPKRTGPSGARTDHSLATGSAAIARLSLVMRSTEVDDVSVVCPDPA